MVTIEEIAQQTKLHDERCKHFDGERERMTIAMGAQETRIESPRESVNLLCAREKTSKQDDVADVQG